MKTIIEVLLLISSQIESTLRFIWDPDSLDLLGSRELQMNEL